MEKYMLNGMMGLIIGDALGNPVQFYSREELEHRGKITDMEAGGVYETDDSSMALATLDSLIKEKWVSPNGIMHNFSEWLHKGKFTSFGTAFDMGRTCSMAIMCYDLGRPAEKCGITGEYANGNGALMRILPICVWAAAKQLSGIITEKEAVGIVEEISALTHNHKRSRIACGLYYFMVRELMRYQGNMKELLQNAICKGFLFYRVNESEETQLRYYARLENLDAFGEMNETDIGNTGYVVDTLEGAVWCLIHTDNYKDALLQAVNMAGDSDTRGAVAGGLAGLYYGYEGIPNDWLQKIKRKEWIEDMCKTYEITEQKLDTNRECSCITLMFRNYDKNMYDYQKFDKKD